MLLLTTTPGVFENLASQQSLADLIVTTTPILPWLLSRIQARESPISQNKQYAAELLAILLQSSQANRAALVALNGVDILLQLLSPYRKRDPVKGGDEEEFVENIFDCATCIVDEVAGKEKFVDAEGVELAIIMLREGKMSKSRALRLLDHAVGGQMGGGVCARIVDAAGLKTVFGMFMKKLDTITTEHLLGIFAALLMLLPAESSARIRTLAKFVEKDYEKIVKLLQLRKQYSARMAVVDAEIEEQKTRMQDKDGEDMEDMTEEWFSRRLDAGLFGLQMTDLCLAWLCAEDDGARGKVRGLLGEAGMGLEHIRETLQGILALSPQKKRSAMKGVLTVWGVFFLLEQIDGMDGEENEEQRLTKDMMNTLVSFL